MCFLIIAKKAKAQLSGMIDERRSLRRLRQDLERVRLLCELIRKREQRKRDLIVNKAQINELQCFPLIYFMRKVSNMQLKAYFLKTSKKQNLKRLNYLKTPGWCLARPPQLIRHLRVVLFKTYFAGVGSS